MRSISFSFACGGFLLATACAVAACGGGVSLGVASQGASIDGGPDGTSNLGNGQNGNGGADGPYSIECTIYNRDLGANPVPQFVEHQLSFRTDQDDTKSVQVTADISANAKLTTTSDGQGSILAIEFPRTGLSQEYELAKLKRPIFDFVGDEGFTGLNYVSTPGTAIDIQYICKAVPLGGTATQRTINDTGTPTLFRATCDVTRTGATPKTEHVLITSFVYDIGSNDAGIRTVDLGSHTVTFPFYDSQFEGRSLTVRISPGSGQSGQVHQQLLQLIPNEPVQNPLRAPGALTGRTTLHLAAADAAAPDDITVACSAE